MICKNCGKEFEGKFCPHCGHDSSKPTKAETAEKRKAAAGKLKEKLKPATDFVKKHKLLVIIVAAVLVAAIIVGTTLGVVLSNDFRVGKMNQIKIGMTKAEVKEKLGEPHEDEASMWYYYSKNYKKLIDEAKKLTGDGEDTGEEDMSEEDFESALGDLDSTIKKLEELEAKAAALLHDEIRISFSDDKVTAVEMLKNTSEETKDTKKEVKKAKLGVEEVQRFTTLITPVYAIVEYTDGSYRNAPVVLKEQPNTENEGKTNVTWHDLWSDTDVTSEINVVKNPNIESEGSLDAGNLEYFIFKTDEGYTLSFIGNGAISANNNKYPWEDIKDKITKVNIANGVTGIGDRAFYGCSSLLNIAIPDSVTSIGSSAFYETGIWNNAAENSIVYADKWAVDYKGDTKTLSGALTLKADTVGISGSAFFGCSNLTSIAIGNGITSIGYGAFSGCSGIETITVAEGNTKYHSAGNCIIETATKTLIAGFKNSVIPTDGSVTSIGDNAFYNCSSLTSIAIPDSVTSIGNSAFSGCSGLTSITIGNSVTSIGTSAFDNCSNLTSIVIPDNVTSIGDWAFYGCRSLTSIAIPDSVTSIGEQAFRGCSRLTSITIGNSVTSIGTSAFDGCSRLTSIAIGNSVTSIGSSAFSYCSNLTSIEIPNGVTSIGRYAFRDCSSLTSIAIPDSVTSIGEGAFKETGIWNNAAENSVVYADKWAVGYKGTISEVTLKADTVGIGDRAFSGCDSLTSVVIGNSVTSIDRYAFSWCDSLTSVVIGNSVTSIGENAFSGCGSLTSIAIPDSVTSIGTYAFSGCSSLTSITIPDSVTSIDRYAFSWCDSLTSVVIGNSVTSIGENAFSGCGSLTSIAIPDSVTSIGDYAFSGCSNLTSIKYQGTKAEWKAITKGNAWIYYTVEYTVTCTDGTLSKAES